MYLIPTHFQKGTGGIFYFSPIKEHFVLHFMTNFHIQNHIWIYMVSLDRKGMKNLNLKRNYSCQTNVTLEEYEVQYSSIKIITYKATVA